MNLKVLAVLLLLGCATTPKVEEPPPIRPAERSSIDVLLRHRSELQLSDEQVERLETIEQTREKDEQAIRASLAERKRELNEGGGRGSNAAPQSNVPPPGMNSRGMGAMPRGRGFGGMGRGQGSVAPRDPDFVERAIQRIDDADTRAFIDAMSQVLTEPQRPQAEKLASDFRAALFDYREALRRRGRPADEE